MAAVDNAEHFIAGLSIEEKVALNNAIQNLRMDVQSARSEEARVRIVEDFIREVRLARKHPRGG